VIYGVPRLVLKVTLDSSNKLLIGVSSVLVVITFITTSGDCNSLGPQLWPPLIASDALLLPLLAAIVGAPRPSPRAVFLLLITKSTPRTSLPKACQVVMSRSSFMVFGCLQPSSCTRVRQVMQDQNTNIILASQILGSSWHF
jgi:hypothetical protein